MQKTTNPLILITNDDGVTSPGLRAAVRAAMPLGDILVVAPTRQWSGAGRSMPHDVDGHTSHYPMEVDGRPITAYQVNASPALVVVRGVATLAPRPPTMLISGINYGENLGSDVTVSGTVGAALQGAAFGIPSLAVSLQTPQETHLNPSDEIDFDAAVHFTRTFASRILHVPLPLDVDVLKLDMPDNTTPDTPWRLTRVSRHAYFVGVSPKSDSPQDPLSPERATEDMKYQPLSRPEHTEPDSDIYALAVDRVVSVAPLSLDLSSRTDWEQIETLLHNPTTD
ncbi:MAG: 5'/3'-nucleotidase SurE [Chloroflexi bacterium]|nr:5'/3'-nucleotidase SurE [Chloroflexota bacterium]